MIISDEKSFVELFVPEIDCSEGFVSFGFPTDGIPLMS